MKINVTMIIALVLKNVAMGIVSIVLGFFPKDTNIKTHITLLSIGLATLAITALM